MPATAVDFRVVFAALPTPYVLMTPGLVVVEANVAYLAHTGRSREQVLGRGLFEAFPPTPDSLDARGVPRVQTVLERVRDQARPQTMPVQKYDIVDAATGVLTEHFWMLVAAPVLDERGGTELLLLRAEDVTEFAATRSGSSSAHDRERDAGWDRRGEAVEVDLFARARELAEALESKETAARRLASLNAVALRLTGAETVEDLERIVVGEGLAVLGADGGGVAVREGDGGVRIAVNAALGAQVQLTYGRLQADSPLPAVHTSRTGRPVLLGTRAAGLAFTAQMQGVYADTGRDAWAFLPLQVRGELLGALAVSWVAERVFAADELEVLDGFAAQCAQALHRVQAAQEQRDAARQVEQLAETLQRALLTPPPEPDHLHLVVRYRSAAHQAQVGGDWYDAFVQPDGATTLVIGDVVGHDRDAAAQMGQLRGLLRALAYADGGDLADGGSRSAGAPPSRVLTRVERAARGLAVDSLASVVLARIERTPDLPVVGTRTLRWSNAGHLPPVLLYPDGTSAVLDTPADLLLGVDPGTSRSDHTVELPDGSTLLLFTDGLIERRGESLDDGLAGLRAAVRDLAGAGLDELCDTLLARLAPHAGEDDIALLAVRSYAEDQPRPVSAGPNRTPSAHVETWT